MSKIGASILRGMKEAVAFAEGTADVSLYRVHIPPEIDVRAIRARLGLTQGRRVPEGPTRAYLMVIDRQPEAVEKALRIA